MIELTIKLDTEKVEEAIRVAWQREFSVPDAYSRGDKGGAGWQEVMRQVKEHIESIDLSEAIARAAKARIANVVDEAVTNALKEKVKQRAKEMMKEGTLL